MILYHSKRQISTSKVSLGGFLGGALRISAFSALNDSSTQRSQRYAEDRRGPQRLITLCVLETLW